VRIKQSFCYPNYINAEVRPATVFAAAKKIGYAAMELWARGDDFDEIIGQAKAAGLRVASMSGHASLQDGMNNWGNHERIEAELRESIDIAAREEIPGLICFSGNRRPYQDDREGIEACAAVLRKVAPHAEARGINLNTELLNSKVNHAGYQADHTDWGVALCAAVGSPRVKLLYDIYHMQIMEGDVIRNLRQNIAYIGHFHTAGNPGRRDLDDEQELNYRGICRAIAATGYELFVGHEFSPKGDPIASLAAAYEICDQG
jgi:hydroxypyruvate isomerase